MHASKLLAIAGLATFTLACAGPTHAVDVLDKAAPPKAGESPARPQVTTAEDSLPVTPHATARPAAAPPARPRAALPLLIDSGDLGFGASVQFSRLPNAAELNDLAYVPNVQHVVVSLTDWPETADELQAIAQAPFPEGADLIVILEGYPPTQAAAAAWNLIRKPLRIVLVVDGPPSGSGMIYELNNMRGLERVIADMREPSRSGFARLQRPISFRVLR